jgi:hypothetical protein
VRRASWRPPGNLNTMLYAPGDAGSTGLFVRI